MSTAWQLLTANSLIAEGTAHEHLLAQRGNTAVQVTNSVTTIKSAAVKTVVITPIAQVLIVRVPKF